MVWCKKSICSAIEGEDFDPHAVVCVKTNKCLDYVLDFYGLNPETRILTTNLDMSPEYENELRAEVAIEVVTERNRCQIS